MKDRRVGRLAALLLALTMGFIGSSHVIGEDIPMLFLFLLSLLFVYRFVQTGCRRDFLLSCAVGALAIGFKLTAGAIVFLIATGYVLWAYSQTNPIRDGLERARLPAAGIVVGACIIYVSFPSTVVAGPTELLTRITHTTAQKTTIPGGLEMPIWAWYLKQFLAGFGWPLFLSLVAGLGAGAIVAVRDRIVPARALLLTVGIAVYLGVFSTWEYVRVHHLLPTFPMLLVLFSIAVERIKNTRWKQVALGVLVVSTGIYAGTGLVGYATEPRDQATEWLATNANDDETVEVYENSIADVAVPHRQRLSRYDFPEENATYNSSLVLDESNYTEWMVNVSERRPEYIQLTPAEFDYVTPGHPDYERYPNRREFISGLVSGKHDYTVVATFGRQSDDQSITEKVLTSGIVPDIEGQTEYIMLLERNT